MNYESFLDSVHNLIAKNNTTTSTYNVSNSLTSSFAAIYKGIDGSATKYPIININYPCVYVEMKSADRDFSELGRQSRRSINGDVDVYVMFASGAGTPEGRYTADKQVLKALENIEKLFDNFISASGACDWINIVRAETAIVQNQDTWNSVGKLSMKFFKLTA